jgi:hypothetical protein
MLQADIGASSCAMLARSLLKMIGVRAPSFSKTYQDGSVFAELDTVASFGGGAARVRPGAEEPFLDANGQPVLGPDGAPLLKKKMPKLGDVVIIASDSGQHGHVFVVTESPDPATHAGIVKRQDQFGRWRAFFNQWYTVAQGGQCGTAKFPDDGSCMGTNEGSHALDSSDWAWGDRKVQYWIDVGALGDVKDAGLVSDTFKDGDVCDDGPIITPDRKIAW